ncbi:YwdI family protein [Pseudoneobacillus sp. C159]
MRWMAISVEQLLQKMESELHKAKQAQGSAKLREHVHSIKILTELILEEKSGGETIVVSAPMPQVAPVSSLTTKKLNEEDANGESLFDF